MEKEVKEKVNIVQNRDCMDAMKEFPDKFFDLAIVDPPYGIGAEEGTGDYSKAINKGKGKKWDVAPDNKYFDELFRISKQTIVWGGNYFNLSISRCWICWYKSDEVKGRDFSEFELAWTNFNSPTRHFSFKPFQKSYERIHPTQKPIALYKWLLKNYAKTNDKILDTHLGSQSSRIAAHQMGFDFWGYELDEDYFSEGCKRFDLVTSQLQLI